MTFLLAVLTTLTLIYGYFGLRIIRPAKIDLKWKISLWVGLLVFYAATPAAFITRYRMPDSPLAIPLAWFAYVSFGFFTLTFAALFARDVLLGGLWVTERLADALPHMLWPSDTDKPADPSRRLFLVNSSNLALLGATGALTGYGLAEARRIPAIKHVDVLLEHLPSPFDGFRILQLTDLHVGLTIRRDYVQAVADRANAQRPDIIAITGDLADGSAGSLRSETAPLADLKAKFGKYFVTGNHEYYSGVNGWLAEVRRLGYTPLINEHRLIYHRGAYIVLAGVTDYRAARIVPGHASNPASALADTPRDSVKIMLAHQPKSVFRAEAAGTDLLIAGHTHGGQYFPFNFMIPLDQPYVHGLHTHGRTQIYVSRGAGYWGPPIRVGAPSEITVLQLIRKTV